MKLFRTKMTFFAILFVSVLTSCQKDPAEPECQTNMAGISGNYKLTSLQYKMNASSAPVDYLTFMDDCEKDDLIVLKSNGIYEYNDIGNICSPNGSDNGTWSIAGNIIISDGIVNGVIENYDCKKLVCYIENVNTPGDRLTLTITRQ